MERLTEKHYGKDGHYMKCSKNCSCLSFCEDCFELAELVDRLAAYEDTGLTPEQVKATSVALEMAREENSALTVERDAAFEYLQEEGCDHCKHSNLWARNFPCCLCVQFGGKENKWEFCGVMPNGD